MMLALVITPIVVAYELGGLFDLYEILPGFLFAWIAIIVFSKMGKQSNAETHGNFSVVQDKLNAK